MKNFDTNNCRLCRKVYCCKSCREKHEVLIHKIMPQCDICCYGNIIASSISENLWRHIETNHWPLYCVFCKKIFSSFEELWNHAKCSAYANLQSPRLLSNKFDSPPLAPNFENPFQLNKVNLLNVISTVVTSTPTQTSDDNLILENIQEVIITPSFAENTIDSIIKKNATVDSNSLSKRRVTFSTQFTDQNLERETEENKRSENSINTPLGFVSTTYYTAKEDLSQENPMFTANKSTPMLPVTKRVEPHKPEDSIQDNVEGIITENKTLWVSAVDLSIPQGGVARSFAAEIKLDSFITPVGNVKKKQISIVMPTPIIPEDTVKFNRPVQISSTPNSSIIPVKSVPTRKDIFRSEEASSSKSNFEITEPTNYSKENSQEYNKVAVSRNCNSSMPNKIWTSVTRMVKNITSVLQNIHTVEDLSLPNSNKSMKRYSSDDNLAEGPLVKRYKLTEIKCRPSIRDLPAPREISREIHINIVSNVISNTNINNMTTRNEKTFADKATQTEESIFENIGYFNI